MTDETSPDARASLTASEVDAAWLLLAEELVLAVNHALANRMAALISLVRVLEFGDSATQPLLPVLQHEVERLERTTALLRILPRETGAPREPVRLFDVVPDAIGLHVLRSEARDLDIRSELDPELLPVWGEPIAISHAVLAMLDALTRRRGGGGAIRISATVIDDSVGLTIGAGTGDHGGIAREVVAALVHRAGGTLEPGDQDGETGVLLARFPTLASVRRQEAGGR